MNKLFVKYDNNFIESGLTTQISWKTVKPQFEEMFCCKPNEVLTGVIITERGIQAFF